MILNGFEYDELSIEYLVSKTLNTQYSKKNEYGCMFRIEILIIRIRQIIGKSSIFF